MNKQNVVYPCHGILFNLKNEMKYWSCCNMDDLWKHNAQGKKLGTKGHILHGSIFMKCPEQQIYKDKIKLVVTRHWWMRRLGSDFCLYRFSTIALVENVLELGNGDDHTALWIY